MGLLNDYQDDFAGWAERIFDFAHKTALKCLRDHLKCNGIFMHSGSGYKTSRGLVKILDYERLPEWPEDEILEMMNTGEFNSKFNPTRQTHKFDTEKSIKRDGEQNKNKSQPLTSVISSICERVKDELKDGMNQEVEIPRRNKDFDPRDLVNLARLNENDMKYSGSDDNFGLKLDLF
ncbi:hypothetical protein GcC1_208041 [Golovinomyces cichoracearum]|uniref:Integrase and RNaseH domain-containing protein n=1 Tax=Golovinomyces cichoracearum TaxID=62708 RepID=A0A420HBK5_9PEZI|nr:hypothetical protein GcC1_208041 [Golovinomyces cichoracearum]